MKHLKPLPLTQEIKTVNQAIKSLNEAIRLLELANYPGPAFAIANAAHDLIDLNKLNEKKLATIQD